MSNHDLDPPSYEAAIGNTTPYQPQTRSHLLQTQLTTTRAQHINNLIIIHVLPLLQDRAQQGLGRTSIALLPTNITAPLPPRPNSRTRPKTKPGSKPTSPTTSKPTTSTTVSSAPASTETTESSPHDLGKYEFETPPTIIDIVSAHDDDDLQQIQLTETIDSAAFWSQPAVVELFRRILKQRLGSDLETSKERWGVYGKDSVEKAKPTPTPTPTPTPVNVPPTKSKGSFLRRLSSKGQKEVPMPVAAAKVEEQSVRERVGVQVASEEICFRTQSSFGLYETFTRPALIVRVVIYV